MQSLKTVAIVSCLVLLLTLCTGCGVSGPASSNREAQEAVANSKPKAQDVVADPKPKAEDVATTDGRVTLVTVDVPADEANEEAGGNESSLPAAATDHDGNLLVLEGDLSGRYKRAHGTTNATFTLSEDAANPGLVLTFPASNAGYPGIELKPEGGNWDLSKYGSVRFTVTNQGDKEALIAFRVDNAGDWQKGPWNTEQASLKPGEKQTVKIVFGHHYGQKPGYPLDPSKVVNILMFTTKVPDGERTFLIEEIIAGGSPGEKPPVDPRNVRVKPVDGFMMGLSQLEAKATAHDGSARVVTDGGKQYVEASLNGAQSSLLIGPPRGRWDLTSACEVSARITNTGGKPFIPTLQAVHDHNRTSKAAAPKSLAPGESVELVSLFVADKPIVFPPSANKLHGGAEHGTGSGFDSGRANGVEITAGGTPAQMKVEYVKATATPIAKPDWLGKRPPVPGEWAMTLDEGFDGRSVNGKLWSVYGPNWWGDTKKTHWSKDNVIVKDGKVTILFEEKSGWHNDSEKSGHRSEFAGGYLDSYGLWRQRYGYFEARMKLPVGPGLWPAFWLMPDLGPEVGPQWKRQSTHEGGMEFDIMEHLTGWGPYRHHVATHWDGYGNEHKSNGADAYVQPDEDGFITSGCLWLPGKLVYYCNGQVIASWESKRVCDKPMGMMFTMPIGGWSNTPFDPKTLPMRWDIDYVRVWQLKELASGIDGYLETPSTWQVDQK